MDFILCVCPWEAHILLIGHSAAIFSLGHGCGLLGGHCNRNSPDPDVIPITLKAGLDYLHNSQKDSNSAFMLRRVAVF
jgi:hypothetical protein